MIVRINHDLVQLTRNKCQYRFSGERFIYRTWPILQTLLVSSYIKRIFKSFEKKNPFINEKPKNLLPYERKIKQIY